MRRTAFLLILLLLFSLVSCSPKEKEETKTEESTETAEQTRSENDEPELIPPQNGGQEVGGIQIGDKNPPETKPESGTTNPPSQGSEDVPTTDGPSQGGTTGGSEGGSTGSEGGNGGGSQGTDKGDTPTQGGTITPGKLPSGGVETPPVPIH
ncbi:MAG: hypothetical protein IKC69_07640 [Clostridia bacterium]|nr:hypothetical protein [Clostridia bacterium]